MQQVQPCYLKECPSVYKNIAGVAISFSNLGTKQALSISHLSPQTSRHFGTTLPKICILSAPLIRLAALTITAFYILQSISDYTTKLIVSCVLLHVFNDTVSTLIKLWSRRSRLERLKQKNECVWLLLSLQS